MGRHTIQCPITGEILTQSNLPPGAEPVWYYSPRASKEEIDQHEKANAAKLKSGALPAFLRHAHQA